MRRDGLTISQSAFSQSDAPQEIVVDVTIDVHGNVTKASVNKSKGAAANLLAQSALDAAWKWRFAPATQGGKPVESHMDLKFVFSGKKR
jgi:TonB family protein